MYHQTGYYLEKEICSGNHKRLLLTQFLHLFHNSFTKTVFTKMIIANIQTNKTNRAIASQAEGHEFEPRLPLKRRHSLIIMLLTDNRESIMSYYVVCKAITSFREIEEMEENLILPTFRKLKFVDCNKPFWRKLMYRAFVRAKSGCDKWHDYEMSVAPYENGKPIYYEFTSCPAAEFAIRHGLTDIMPALCNVDYASMELLHAKLVRTTTCVDGCRCDYTICGDKDPYLKGHPEYRDEAGFRRNR